MRGRKRWRPGPPPETPSKAAAALILASGFYEWKKEGKTKTPYAIVPSDTPLFALPPYGKTGATARSRERAVDSG